jgi:hypothetical protein
MNILLKKTCKQTNQKEKGIRKSGDSNFWKTQNQIRTIICGWLII